MKIAVPTRQGFVDDQLACCEYYTIYTIDERHKIISRETVFPEMGSCCSLNPAARLRQKGVSIVLAGNIESSLYTRLTGSGMEVYRNFHGETDKVVKSFIHQFIEGDCEYCRLNDQPDHLNN